ncbi:glycerophosphodiester phosphodiesterase family protein [Gammaproteobacteria bacterium]|jgi:glycerophosphoryl diester phosphodiesterase|nr:glycerophosphodiester phosphodiesterase family protein [Gammaproteobacteria bacterium]MDA9947063.1 glycerophosphodiester phosphodiesterase family protein [bacterium]MDA8798807.1 glycerophosphodiester phosphodiesterase family protein [Gammaproteobacteria bacterium]MDA9204807.1 glycerophosphodiester phosphodiesterase family protein [Gammaproteobacteria bacterium]MDA9800664.1 glycerophosphodiester phosphodiesterase family protein [Gammaproteobacteria bacterium]
MTIHPYLNQSGVSISAHRGGSEEAPENTLESFSYAIGLGSSYIETDVQLSADGIPYIFHDDDLSRLLNMEVKFNSLHSDQIEKLKLFESYQIPKLETALTQFPNALFQIDLKTDEVALPAMKVIENLNAFDRICIASFSSNRLQKVRKKFPDTCLSMGPKEILKLLLASFGLYNKTIYGDCLQVPIYHYGIKLVTRRFVKYVQSIGLKIHVWTINDENTMRKLIDLGVDGIITDRPKLLKEVLSKN